MPLGVTQYVLNDVLRKPGVYMKGYFICVRPLYVLGYTRFADLCANSCGLDCFSHSMTMEV